MPTSRELLLEDLTTWIQCQNDASKRETAERIEQKWQAEYHTFITPGAPSWLERDALQILAALKFPYSASENAENGNFRDGPLIANDEDKDICGIQKKWISDAAEWINFEREGKSKSKEVCKWEATQRNEFQNLLAPTKESCLKTYQISFLSAIGFKLAVETVDLTEEEEHNVMPDVPRSAANNIEAENRATDAGGPAAAVAAANPPNRRRDAPVMSEQQRRHQDTNEAHTSAASTRLDRKRGAPQVPVERNQSRRQPQYNGGHAIIQGQGFFYQGPTTNPLSPVTKQPHGPNAQRQPIGLVPAYAAAPDAGRPLPNPFHSGSTPDQQVSHPAPQETFALCQGTQRHLQSQVGNAYTQQVGYPTVRTRPPRQVTQGSTRGTVRDGRGPLQLIYAPATTRAKESPTQAQGYMPVGDNRPAMFCEPLGCEEDTASLPTYLSALNSHLELFEIEPADVFQNDQGENERICVGQIGIRCRYCNKNARFPKNLSDKTNSVEATVEAIGRHHLTSYSGGGCLYGQAKDELVGLKEKHTVNQDSKANIGEYYSRKLEAMGIYEGFDGDVGHALFRDTLHPGAPGGQVAPSSRPIMPSQSRSSEGNQVANGPTPGAAVRPFRQPLSSIVDEGNLSDYYCFGREQIEVFSVTEEKKRHRNQTHVPKGQVGIRCKHCHHEAFPKGLKSVHGATMSLIEQHLMKTCIQFGQVDRNKMINLKKSQKKGCPVYSAKDSNYVQRRLRMLQIQDHPTKAMLVQGNMSSIQDV